MLLTTLLLGVTPAYADNLPSPVIIDLEVIPPCELIRVKGATLCAYNLVTWKEVVAADIELVHIRIQLKNERLRSSSLTQQINLLVGQGKIYSKTQENLVIRVDKLTEDLIEMNLKYENANARSRIGSALSWTVSAVSTSILVGFVASRYLN